MKVKLKSQSKNKKPKFLKELNKISDDNLKSFIKSYIKDNSVEDYLIELTKIILSRRN
jgi:hypothetical protein